MQLRIFCLIFLTSISQKFGVFKYEIITSGKCNDVINRHAITKVHDDDYGVDRTCVKAAFKVGEKGPDDPSLSQRYHVRLANNALNIRDQSTVYHRFSNGRMRYNKCIGNQLPS